MGAGLNAENAENAEDGGDWVRANGNDRRDLNAGIAENGTDWVHSETATALS